MEKITCKTEGRSYYNTMVKLEELKELADRIIYLEGWDEVDTDRYDSEEFVIVNPYNRKSYKLTTKDTEETIRAAIKEVSGK